MTVETSKPKPSLGSGFMWVVIIGVLFSGISYSVTPGLSIDLVRARAGKGYHEVSLVELLRLRQQKGTLIYDVRDSRQFAAGHIPGAMPFALELNAKNLPIHLPAANHVVLVGLRESPRLYQVHQILLSSLSKTTRLSVFPGGYDEWLECGLPVDNSGAEQK